MMTNPLSSGRPGHTPDRAEAPPSHVAFRAGVYVGALLIIVMLGALVAANRIPVLERYALERNAACYGLFFVLMLVPILRFLGRPRQMFVAGTIAWLMFVVGYDLVGLYFRNLFKVLRSPLEALAEGAVIYGVFAVGSWVTSMILHARHNPMSPGRRRVDHAATHHR